MADVIQLPYWIMEQLKRSIEKLLNKQGKRSKQKSSSKLRHNFSEYANQLLSKQEIKVRSQSYQHKHHQQQQNLRLYRKLTAITQRQNTYDHSPDGEVYDRVYRLNMASRRLQREIKDKHVQQQNNHLIERIIKIRSQRTPAFFEAPSLQHSRQRRRKSNKSALLPPIVGSAVDD